VADSCLTIANGTALQGTLQNANLFSTLNFVHIQIFNLPVEFDYL